MGTLWLWANYFLCSLSLLIWKMGIIALTPSQGLQEYYLKMICKRGRYTLYPKGRSLVTISIVIRCTPEGPLFLTWTRWNGDSWFPGKGKKPPNSKGFRFAVTFLDTGEKPPVLTRPTDSAGERLIRAWAEEKMRMPAYMNVLPVSAESWCVWCFKLSPAAYLLCSDNNKSQLMKSGDSSVMKVQGEELGETQVQPDPGY